MKVEIWSDFMCPFCYIGKRHFEAALVQFPHKESVEVIFRSFELDPQAERDVDFDVHDMLAAKYGMSREQALANNERVGATAKAAGLSFNFDDMILTNTFDAHRLTHFAARNGKGNELAERLFRAYFTDSKHLGHHETLVALASEAGLDAKEAAAALAGGAYAQNVREDEEEAARLGVRGVPFFVIDRKYAVSGAQPSSLFLDTLHKAWGEASLLQVVEGGDACGDGYCAPDGGK
ncbi:MULTISPECIES: DsbA family oxidoreductase [Paenibacillus]|uniref:DsbA family oxidoreductase n=1 Tax=Paenibacillus TaxID=44249 RepID=UPI0022B87A87|nr:DsbA family oxidoreductase [Paenibacillus caseinilyticus]MCZ8521763.1 DsbA family oxidoreductase [Paenibacillus caseinilyticus]